ncbi:MAG TPA: hypothetical protein VFC46_03725 [Humisphaera sp.]|nr:hypothetical protein [Humisphaera sp.]
MVTTDELFDRMMMFSDGNPHSVMSLEDLGAEDSITILATLVREGRAHACSIGGWRLPVEAIATTASSSTEDDARLIADVNAMLPPNVGWFAIKDLVAGKGWTFRTAIATAMSLVQNGRLENGSLGNFRIIMPGH